MNQISILAMFTIKSEFNLEFQSEFKKIVEESRKEEGCIQYDLHQDIKEANTYLFIEIWQSEQAVERHNTQLHFKNFAKFADGKVINKVVHMTKQVI